MLHSTVKRRPLLAASMFMIAATLVMSGWLTGSAAASLYGIAVFAILGTKLTLSLLPARRWARPHPALKVGAVVTVHNEEPELLRRCLRSLNEQSFRPDRIVVVDDGSATTEAFNVAQEHADVDPRVTVIRQRNSGKRHALAAGFRELGREVDVFFCADSDSVYERNAIYEGVRPFRSPKVTAVTGMVLPLNHDATTLTRLQDVRYTNSFVGERAAYSQLGSVLCVCGAIAFWRSDVVLRHLDEFLDQTFLGRAATVGDDRHLTNLSLTEGRVVLAPKSIGHTAVPERLGHYVRQQARWGRSFFRESAWALRRLGPARPAWWLTLLEVAQWAVFSTLLGYVVFVHPLITGEWLIGEYLLMIGGMAVARSVRFFDVRRDGQSNRSRAVTFATSPLYGYLSLLVLLPLRMWSLLTLRMTGWGTRSAVEVSPTADPPPVNHEKPVETIRS